VSRAAFKEASITRWEDLKARAFVITGVENANVVQSVRDLIAENGLNGHVSPPASAGQRTRLGLSHPSQGRQ